mmetsp:Transcript_13236/g.40688  ORF Transcript_13236/g.40688 Transcript_13236/m.40688 type:complete len:317 (-) Transcript_13236:130-1080(-)
MGLHWQGSLMPLVVSIAAAHIIFEAEPPKEIIDAGHRAMRLVQRAECQEPLVGLMDLCEVAGSEALKETALALTICYLKAAGRKSPECDTDEARRLCTKHMSAHEFEIFTYFYTNLPAICLLEKSARYRSDTGRLIDSLKMAAEAANAWLEKAESRGRELEKSLQQTRESYRELHNSHASLTYALKSNKQETEKLLRTAQAEADVLAAKHFSLLRSLRKAYRHAEETHQLSTFGGTIRDHLLTCAVLLISITLASARVMLMYGATGIILKLPLSVPMIVIGGIKLLRLQLVEPLHLRRAARKGSSTIQTGGTRHIL